MKVVSDLVGHNVHYAQGMHIQLIVLINSLLVHEKGREHFQLHPILLLLLHNDLIELRILSAVPRHIFPLVGPARVIGNQGQRWHFGLFLRLLPSYVTLHLICFEVIQKLFVWFNDEGTFITDIQVAFLQPLHLIALVRVVFKGFIEEVLILLNWLGKLL